MQAFRETALFPLAILLGVVSLLLPNELSRISAAVEPPEVVLIAWSGVVAVLWFVFAIGVDQANRRFYAGFSALLCLILALFSRRPLAVDLSDQGIWSLAWVCGFSAAWATCWILSEFIARRSDRN